MLLISSVGQVDEYKKVWYSGHGVSKETSFVPPTRSNRKCEGRKKVNMKGGLLIYLKIDYLSIKYEKYVRRLTSNFYMSFELQITSEAINIS